MTGARHAAFPSIGRAHPGGDQASGALPSIAREHGGGYEAGGADGHDDAGMTLGSKVAGLRRLAREVVELASDPDDAALEGGELSTLLSLLDVLEHANAAAVELTIRTRARGHVERAHGLPLEQLLALKTRATYGDRRTLLSAAEELPSLPNIRAAFRAGRLGWAQVRAILAEARVLDAEQRAQLDTAFADHDRLSRLDPDALVDEVRAAVDRLRPDLHERAEVRRVERRYVHAQPDLEGGISGHFALPGEAGAAVLSAIDAAAPPPSAGPRDLTRDALGHADADEPEEETADGLPGFTDEVMDRSLARRRADGLTAIAEYFLAGGPSASGGGGTDGCGDGRAARRRPQPSMITVADIATLAGDDASARAARALLATVGGRFHLTATAIRRLAEDATLRFLLTDRGEVLGISEPTELRASQRPRGPHRPRPGLPLPRLRRSDPLVRRTSRPLPLGRRPDAGRQSRRAVPPAPHARPRGRLAAADDTRRDRHGPTRTTSPHQRPAAATRPPGSGLTGHVTSVAMQATTTRLSRRSRRTAAPGPRATPA